MYIHTYTYNTHTYIRIIYIYIYVYDIYETLAEGICLICTHEPKGVQPLRASADISGKSQLHRFHMLCNTCSTLNENLSNLCNAVVLLIITADVVYDYGVFILTFV